MWTCDVGHRDRKSIDATARKLVTPQLADYSKISRISTAHVVLMIYRNISEIPFFVQNSKNNDYDHESIEHHVYCKTTARRCKPIGPSTLHRSQYPKFDFGRRPALPLVHKIGTKFRQHDVGGTRKLSSGQCFRKKSDSTVSRQSTKSSVGCCQNRRKVLNFRGMRDFFLPARERMTLRSKTRQGLHEMPRQE